VPNEIEIAAGKPGTIVGVGRCMAFLVLALLVLLVPDRAVAATATWDGGCGPDTDWSCAANWSEDTPPGAEDTAVFDSSGGTSTVDAGFGGNVAAVRLNAKFSGTLNLARPLTVTKAFSQQGGTFRAGGEPLTLKALSALGGSFVASSGATEVDGSLKVAATAHFDANGGTIELGGAGASLSCAGVVFNHVVFANATGTKSVGAGCILPLGGNPSAGAGGSIKLNGTLAGSGTLTTSGTLTLGAGGNLSGFSGLVANALSVAGPDDFDAYSTFTVAKNFILSSGASFTAPAATASFASNFTIKPGATFDANGGTVLFGGTAGGKLYCANQSFHLVRFVHTAGRKIVGADCSLSLGNDPTLGQGEGSVTLNGGLSGSGTLTALQRFILNGTASLSGFGGFVGGDSLYANGVEADFGSYNRFEVTSSYVQTGGTVTVPAGASFKGQFVLNPESTFDAPPTGSVSYAERFAVSASASFNPSGSTTVFDGTVSASIVCGPATFNRVVFANTAGTKTVGSSCDLPLGNDPSASAGGSIVLNGSLSGSGTLATGGTLTLGEGGQLSGFSGLSAENLMVDTSAEFGSYGSFAVGGNLTIDEDGSFIAPSGVASIAGNFVNGGSFIANGGTVVLDGAKQQLTGNTTFDKLTKVAGGPATLAFAAGSTTTVGGKLTMLGASYDKPLKLASSVVGKAWRIVPEGEVEVGSLSVGDSNNLGAPIVASESFNAGGNTGWIISGPATSLSLTAASTTPTAGTADNLTIAAKDAYGNTATSYTGSHNLTFGPVADSPSGAHATVTNFGTPTQIAFSEGTATVSGGKNGVMTLVKAGSVSLTVSDGSLSNGSGLAVTVSPAGASELVLAAASTTPTAGTADNLTIAAKDAYGNTATSYTGSHNLTFGPVADSPSGAHATVTNFAGGTNGFGTPTQIAFSEGTATVSGGKNGVMTLVKAGSVSLTVSDGSLSNGSGLAVTVSPSSPSSLSLAAATTTPTAGTTDNLTIAAKDAYGNTATSYTGSHNLTFGPVADSPSGAHATVSDSSGSAVNFGTATPIAFSEGTATVSGSKNGVMTLVKAGSTSLTVSDGSLSNGSGLAVTVSPSSPSSLSLAAATTTPKAGEADNLTITAKDAYGNTATSYTGSHNLTFGPVADSPSGAHATVSDSSGSAVNFGTATLIAFSEGIATVSGSKNGVMTLVKAGSVSLTVSDGSLSNGSGLAVTVSPSSPSSLSLAAATTTPKAGEADNLTIAAKDGYGNTATSYTGSHNLTFGPVSDSPSGAHATVSDSSGSAVNLGTATPIAFSEGIATVSGSKNGVMTLVKAGSVSLTVTDGSLSNGSGLAVSVSPAAATRLAWTNAKVSKGTLSSPCLFTCTGTELSSSGTFKANVSVTDSSGNTVSALGSGHTVSVTMTTGTITGGSLTIASSGPAESTTQFTFTPPSKGGASTLTAATAAGTVYTSATASMSR
jgi:hypothetical protein